MSRVVCWFVLLISLGASAFAQETPEAWRPGARLAFPNHGVVNAFVIFVQHPDEVDGAGDFGSDPETEWPISLSRDAQRLIPAWANEGRLLATPGTEPGQYDDGSISAFYNLMSQGRFSLTGYVYPRVYHPQQPVAWYHENRGNFANGVVKLSHEILNSSELQSYFSQNPDGLDLAALDTYRNGTNEYGSDGVFDLIILIHRNITLPRLRLDREGNTTRGSSISSLGADVDYRPTHGIDYREPDTDAFLDTPVTLGNLRVIDNVTSGSGITVHALSRKQAVRIITHEIGHRHFGYYHTCESAHSPDSDCIGIMGGAYVTMSAGDRIKLGWADVVPVDLPSLGRLDVTFADALQSGKVYRLRTGRDQCGDMIVEARFWNNFWDAPPNPDKANQPFYRNDDGDQGDLFLPQEGLYLYKAPEVGNVLCGGNLKPEFEKHTFSSLENSGIGRRIIPFQSGHATEMKAFRVGGTYKVAYTPGDRYAPFDRPMFFFHRNFALDDKLTITNISRQEGAFSAEIWTDYLNGSEADAMQLVVYPNPPPYHVFVEYTLPEETTATLTLYDLQGRRVVRLAEGLHQAGRHKIYYEPEGLASGLYWWRLDTPSRSTTSSMRIIR